jgi:RES domain-containing protein
MASRPSGPLKLAPWRAYRIADRRHKIFDGEGAATFGGRWNSPGRRVIYAAQAYAGAMLEVLVNANIGRMPKQYAWIEILIGEQASSKRWMRVTSEPAGSSATNGTMSSAPPS